MVFFNNGGKDKQHAARVTEIYDEVSALKNHYSDQLAAQVKDHYPALRQYVMERAEEGSSFIMAWDQRYSQSTVTLNLPYS